MLERQLQSTVFLEHCVASVTFDLSSQKTILAVAVHAWLNGTL